MAHHLILDHWWLTAIFGLFFLVVLSALRRDTLVAIVAMGLLGLPFLLEFGWKNFLKWYS